MLCCVHCKVEIAKPSDVFSMSKEGVQGNYCNPGIIIFHCRKIFHFNCSLLILGGHVYEIVTVLEAKNFDLAGDLSKEFTWFPGYVN